MTIASRLRMNALVTVGMVLLIGLAAAVSFNLQRESRERGIAAGEMLAQASELRSLATDFLKHPEERSKQEFERIKDSLAKTLSGTAKHQSPRVTTRMLQNLADAKVLFAELVASSTNGDPALAQARRELLADEILARTNQISLDASRTLAINNAELKSVTRKITVFTAIIAAVMAMIVLWSSGKLRRAIAAPLQALRSGTELVGTGNLEYRVGTKSNDEIGDLSRSFDRMAEQLQGLYASLRQEQEKLEQAKRHVEDTAVQLRSVLENMTERLYVCDSSGHPILTNEAFRVGRQAFFPINDSQNSRRM